MRAILSIIALAIILPVALIACESASHDVSPTNHGVTPTHNTEVSSDVALIAHRLVFAYLSDKAWGFFGATCDMWVDQDYVWEKSMTELQDDGRIKVTYSQHPDRILGPEQLVFYVNIDSHEIQGDNKPETDTGRLGIAEGCDQW